MSMPLISQTNQRPPLSVRRPVLKVIGIGGGGNNAINRMIELGLSGVDYIAANTDAQVLKSSLAPIKIQLGPLLTRGLGAGGNPITGEAAAEESISDLHQAMKGADMVFLTSGMGGGTGTGAIPVVARIARSLGIVSVSIVTTPFSFEMGKRQINSREGLAKLRKYSDTLITVPNDRLLQFSKNTPMELAFRLADDVLRQGIQGITELITKTGYMNVDFSHVREVMQRGGGSLLALGQGKGEGKAIKAIDAALHHPLIDQIELDDATAIIANFTCGADISFMEIMDALAYLQEKTHHRAEVIPGVITEPEMSGKVEVILVITGIGATPVDTQMISLKEPVQIASPVSAAVPACQMASVEATTALPAIEKQPQRQSVGATADLDIPAFMRRRVR